MPNPHTFTGDPLLCPISAHLMFLLFLVRKQQPKSFMGCYSKMFSKAFLDTYNIRFFDDVYIGEGFNFNVLAFCSASKVVVSQHKVYYYRLDNSTSAMNKFNVDKCAMGLEAIDIIRKNLRIKSKEVK